MWKEWKSIQTPLRLHISPFMKKPLIEKYLYRYKNKNGEISIIRINLPNLRFNPRKPSSLESRYEYLWESCGVMEYNRFKTRHEAEIAIFKALGEEPPKEKLIVQENNE